MSDERTHQNAIAQGDLNAIARAQHLFPLYRAQIEYSTTVLNKTARHEELYELEQQRPLTEAERKELQAIAWYLASWISAAIQQAHEDQQDLDASDTAEEYTHRRKHRRGRQT